MEKVRKLVRGVLGWDSIAYRSFAKALNLISLITTQSLQTTIKLQRMNASSADVSAQAVEFRGLDYPFYIRPGTRDVSVAINNFVRREYGAILPPSNPSTFVDGGAYIGDVSAYFLSRYPEIKGIALEPIASSYELATINLHPYGSRVDLRRRALTADGKPVFMSGAKTAARIDRTLRRGDEIESVTIPQILEELPGGRIDILKLDIEGAEVEIFSTQPELWLDRVGFLIIETHGPASTNITLKALKNNGWQWYRARNLYFCKQR